MSLKTSIVAICPACGTSLVTPIPRCGSLGCLGYPLLCARPVCGMLSARSPFHPFGQVPTVLSHGVFLRFRSDSHQPRPFLLPSPRMRPFTRALLPGQLWVHLSALLSLERHPEPRVHILRSNPRQLGRAHVFGRQSRGFVGRFEAVLRGRSPSGMHLGVELGRGMAALFAAWLVLYRKETCQHSGVLADWLDDM